MLNDFPLSHGGGTLRLEKITASNVKEAAAVIQRAFAIWADLGFKPQSAELAASYLLPDGYTVLDSNHQVIGTFCVREATLRFEGDTVVVSRAHRLDRARLHSKEQFLDLVRDKKLVYFYGFSVDPPRGKAGLGRALIGDVEQMVKKLGYHGLMLETGKESSWLVEWYRKLGFEIIGESAPEKGPARTIMMLKSI